MAEEIEAVLLEFAFGVEFFLDCGFVGVNAVINDADIFGFKFGGEESQFIGDETADGKNGVAVLGGIDERVLEVLVLRAEDVLDVEFLLVRFFDDVVKHRVVAGVVFDDFPHRRDFMGIEDGFIIAGGIEHSGHRGGHTHILMGDNDGFAGGCADCFEDSQGGRGKANILFEFPEFFVAVAFNAEFFEHISFEFVDRARVGVANVDEDDFGRGFDSGLGIDEGSSAVDYADVEEGFDFGKGGCVAGPGKAVEGRIKDFAVVAEPVEDGPIGGEQRSNDDGALNGIEV